MNTVGMVKTCVDWAIRNQALIMGSIYQITCLTNDKIYIGQTAQSDPTKRWKDHLSCAKFVIRCKNGTSNADMESPTTRSILGSRPYCAMAKHGIANFVFDVIDTVDVVWKLNSAEILYISFLDTVAKGYNSTSGGGSRYHHHPESIAKMKQRKLETLDRNRHACLAGLPPCVTYNAKLGSIIVVKHPLCEHLTFNIEEHGSIEQTAEVVRAFIQNLIDTGTVYKKTKIENDLLQYPGLKATPKGYRISKQIKKGNPHCWIRVR